MKQAFWGAAAISFLLAGCAGPSLKTPSAYSTPPPTTYDASFDQVWESAVDWFAVNNIPIKNIEKDSGIIGSEYSLGSDYSQIDCGRMDTGNMFLLNDQKFVANINVLVRESDDGVLVKPNVFGHGTFQLFDAWNGRPKTIEANRCVSTGNLERSLHSYLESNI